MGLKHSYKSLKTDPTDPTIIGATKWNDDHYYVDGAGAPIGNVGAVLLAGAAGALTHLNSVAAGSVLTSAGVGALPIWAAAATVPAALTVNTLTFNVATPDVVLSRSAATLLGLAGGLVATGPITSTDHTLAAAGLLAFATRSVLRSPADSRLLLTNAAGTDFSLLQFGGTTAAFPALRRSTNYLEVMTADASAYTTIRALSFTVSNGVIVYSAPGNPEGAVAAPQGSLFLSTAGTLYVKQTGAAGATGWVAK